MPETLYSLDYQVAWIANVSDRYSSLVLFNPEVDPILWTAGQRG